MSDEKAASAPGEGFSLMKFLGEVNVEMKKVQWSTRRELFTDTAVVAVAVVIVCTLIWLCDTFFARLFSLILK